MEGSKATPFDVAVVGLGPVGAAAAQLLAREGLAVLAIEPNRAPYDKPRAIGIDHESLRLLQAIGLADEVAPILGAYAPSEYRSASGALLRRIVPQPEPHPFSWPPYATFVQPQLEAILRAGLDRWPTLQPAFGEHVASLQQTAAGVQLTLADDEGSTREATARYVVACDGARSPIRESLGLGLEDLDFDEPWLVVDVLVNDGARLPDTIVQYCDPARPATYIAGPGMLRRWEIMLLPGEDPVKMTEQDVVWALLSPWLTSDQGQIWRAATYRFHALVGRRWREGGVFLAGDAAHQTPPFMAQGLNQGLRDAGNLCWKLGQVLRHGASPGLLDSYEAERLPNARAVIALTKQLGRLICERDPISAAERDRGMAAEVAAGRGEIVRQNLLPPLTGGFLKTAADGGHRPGVGTLLPQPMVVLANGELRRMDDALNARFLLIAPPDWRPNAAERVAARRLGLTFACLGSTSPDPAVTPICERDPLIADWMRRHEAIAVVVRPDRVIFSVARAGEDVGGLIVSLDAELALTAADGIACEAPTNTT